MDTIKVDGIEIGPGRPCFIVAEAGVNHNGSPTVAKKLVDVAVAAGADAVKFQTFTAEKVVTASAPKAAYQVASTGAEESQLEMLRRLELSREAHEELRSYCLGKGILFMSTPFDEESADFLESLRVPLFKIPSGEITNLPFLEHVARKGKPLIISTGMSWLAEVEAAVRTVEGAGNGRIVLLHCVSNYPAEPADVNLRAMVSMSRVFGVPVGYSDHTTGIEVALAAAAMGACILEKHFTLDRATPGPDHAASLEPDELAALVRGVRTIERAMGDGRKRPAASEAGTAAVARKSLTAALDIRAGEVIAADMVVARRPGTGLAPSMKAMLVGRRARVDIPAGSLFTWAMIG